jgi:ClpP class serine protease
MSAIDDVLAETWEVSDSGDYIMSEDDNVVCWMGWTSPAELVRAQARAAVASKAPRLVNDVMAARGTMASALNLIASGDIEWAEDALAKMIDRLSDTLAAVREAAGE